MPKPIQARLARPAWAEIAVRTIWRVRRLALPDVRGD